MLFAPQTQWREACHRGGWYQHEYWHFRACGSVLRCPPSSRDGTFRRPQESVRNAPRKQLWLQVRTDSIWRHLQSSRMYTTSSQRTPHLAEVNAGNRIIQLSAVAAANMIVSLLPTAHLSPCPLGHVCASDSAHGRNGTNPAGRTVTASNITTGMARYPIDVFIYHGIQPEAHCPLAACMSLMHEDAYPPPHADTR